MNHIFFYLGLTLILVHEMDAIRCKEWRIIPGLSLLEDKLGQKIFIIAHVPLYFLLFLGLANPGISAGLVLGLNIFFIFHLGLHLLFVKHKKNEFKDLISWVIIVWVGVMGVVGLVVN